LWIIRGKEMSDKMSRREFLVFAGTGIAVASTSCVNWPRHAGSGRPNIIFIFVDDMGYADLSCYGNKDVQTANIDRLAEQGIRFKQFYVNSPICSPSRVAVTTGMYPARWGIYSYLSSRSANDKRGMADYLDPAAPSLARTLKQAGYATGHFGKWHMGGGRDVDDAPHPQAYGFDKSVVSFEGLGARVLPPGGLSRQSEKLGQGDIRHAEKHDLTEIYVNRAIEFIRENKDKPFYINLWPNDVHDSHRPKPELLEKYKEFADNKYKQRFYAVLDELDRQIGRVTEEIERLGLDDSTLIVFASDNGPTDRDDYYEEGFEPPGSVGPLYGRKWSLYEGGIRVPFVVRWKGTIPQGKVNEESVICGLDLFASLCSIAGIDLEVTNFDGEDMSRALMGREIRRSSPIFWEYRRNEHYLKPGNPDYVSPNLAVREGDWKLLIKDDGSDVQLYNLRKDIGETTNLVEEYPKVAGRL